MVGLSVVQFLKVGGAENIVVLEPRPKKRELAIQLGADLALDPAEIGDGCANKRVRAMCNGVGADVVYACANSAAIGSSVDLVRKEGQVIVIGASGAELPVAPFDLLAKAIELKGVAAYTEEFGIALRLLSRGKMITKPMVSDIIPLEDVVERGFARLAVPNDLVRVVVAP